MGALVQVLSSAKGAQRVMIVALTLIPLLLVTASLLPALIVLPFLPGGVDRVRKIVAQLIIWTRAILKGASVLSYTASSSTSLLAVGDVGQTHRDQVTLTQHAMRLAQS